MSDKQKGESERPESINIPVTQQSRENVREILSTWTPQSPDPLTPISEASTLVSEGQTPISPVPPSVTQVPTSVIQSRPARISRKRSETSEEESLLTPCEKAARDNSPEGRSRSREKKSFKSIIKSALSFGSKSGESKEKVGEATTSCTVRPLSVERPQVEKADSESSESTVYHSVMTESRPVRKKPLLSPKDSLAEVESIAEDPPSGTIYYSCVEKTEKTDRRQSLSERSLADVEDLPEDSDNASDKKK